jgi:DNA-binding IscR family transcriptional regulator
VAKVINKLKKSGLIKTRTGKNGGIEVDKMVLDKSLYDILNAMGIRMEMNVCINHPEICSQKPFCKVTHRLGAIQTVMMSMLMDSKIKDFI